MRLISVDAEFELVRRLVAVLLMLSLTVLPSDATADQKLTDVVLSNLSGIDLRGRLHRFAKTADCKAVTFVFLSIHCPVSNASLPTLRKIAARYARRGVAVYGVISAPGVTRADAVKHSSEYRIGFPVLFDASLELRRALQPSHTPQAIVLSPAGRVRYSGRIDDRFTSIGRKRSAAGVHDLDNALSAIIHGDRIKVPVTVAVGCPLEDAPRRDADGDVTFNREIAPLILAHCTECHRPGQSAPFSLLTFKDVTSHAKQIVNVTSSRFMPPWHPARDFGHFRDVRRLSDSEIELIRLWVSNGCAEGDAADLPSPPKFRTGWQLGRPDLVLRMPSSFKLSADGPDVHQHFVLPTGLRRDRLVAAVEFHAGNSRVVHHASFYVDISGAARATDERDPDLGFGGGPGPRFDNIGSLRSWLPGMSPRRLPAGTGQPLHARSDVVLEIHYQRSGKPETDRSEIGIFYADSKARQMVYELQVMGMHLDIPAGAARHRHRASYTLPVAATLLDAAPHMHLLGRELKATATLPDGQIKPLIWIRDWDFNWQGQYIFTDSIRLPAGTRIDVDAWYDNSAGNALNPHSPPRRVVWGTQTTDEMGICHFLYTCDSRDDLQQLNKDHLRDRTSQGQHWLQRQSQPSGR